MSAPSIEQLQELPPPPGVSYMPQTWGWLLIAGIVVLLAAAWLIRKVYRWRQDRYRRDALARFDQLVQNLDNAALREVPELLKRVALSIPRQTAQHPDVASLNAEAWQDFLQRSSPLPLPGDFARQLATLAYAPDATLQRFDKQQRQQLFHISRQWVETHHVAA